MPTYEYRCKQCGRRTSRFFRSFSQAKNPTCSHCGSTDLPRLPSTFAFRRALDAGRNLPSFETMGDYDENDPKSVSRWVEGMRRDMGEEFGHDFDDMLEEAAEPGYGDGDDGSDGDSDDFDF